MKASDNEFPKLILTEGAAPSTPATGTMKVYAKDDKRLYAMDDTGTETDLTGGGIPDAPSDGKTYGRKDGDWTEITGSGGGGITSPTINRIITSTDPDEPLDDGDLLVVLPLPRVVAVASSPQTYGGADSVSSISANIPIEAKEGDLILVLVSSFSEPSTPIGFTQEAKTDSLRTEFSTGMGWSAAYSAVATGSSAGASVTVSQASAGRMAIVILIVRGANGAQVVDAATEVYAAPSVTNPGLHPIPSVESTKTGQLAITTCCCALANGSADTTVAWPSRWVPITPTSSPATPTYNRMRSWAAYTYLQSGEDTDGVMGHTVNNHDGSAITLLVESL